MARRSEIKILIADPSTVGRQLLEQILENLGITHVFTARAASEARKIMAQRPIDLLIADMDLPELDGLALLASLRSGAGHGTAPGGHSDMRVILSTANPDFSDMSDARKLDLSALLLKPYRVENVLHCVEVACGRI